MTSNLPDHHSSGRQAEIKALEQLHSTVQNQLRDFFGDDQPQPSREELERRWGNQFRSDVERNTLSKMFF